MPKFVIHFMNPESRRKSILADVPKIWKLAELAATHVPVHVCEVSSKEKVLESMQMGRWSPSPESRDRMRAAGIERASMMKGDVVEDLNEGNFWQVVPHGLWKLS